MTPAALALVSIYAPGTPPGARATLARAVRRGAASASRPAHHAPPYPVPVVAWRGRAW